MQANVSTSTNWMLSYNIREKEDKEVQKLENQLVEEIGKSLWVCEYNLNLNQSKSVPEDEWFSNTTSFQADVTFE